MQDPRGELVQVDLAAVNLVDDVALVVWRHAPEHHGARVGIAGVVADPHRPVLRPAVREGRGDVALGVELGEDGTLGGGPLPIDPAAPQVLVEVAQCGEVALPRLGNAPAVHVPIVRVVSEAGNQPLPSPGRCLPLGVVEQAVIVGFRLDAPDERWHGLSDLVGPECRRARVDIHNRLVHWEPRHVLPHGTRQRHDVGHVLQLRRLRDVNPCCFNGLRASDVVETHRDQAGTVGKAIDVAIVPAGATGDVHAEAGENLLF